MWITALAAAALMLPLARSLLEDEGERPGESRFGRSLMMAVAWGPLIGALAAPSGSGSNPVALRFLAEIGGLELGFLDWMAFGVPTAALLLPIAWLVLMALSPPERRTLRTDAAKAAAAHGRGLNQRIPLSRDEKAVAVVFLAVIACWLAAPSLASILGFKPSIGMVAALGASAIFLPGVTSLQWKDLEKSMDWAGVLLIATGVSLGTALYRSGAAAWVAGIAFGGIGSLAPFWRLFAVAVGVLVVKVVFSSNTLTGTIIVPLVLALGPALGLDMRLAALAAGFTANLAVLLVTTSPVNVLPWTTGFFSIKDMAVAGLALAPAAAVIIAAVLSLVGPLYGLG
jgi:sodium-dependent dicarboxylate transporter 2/3/5